MTVRGNAQALRAPENDIRDWIKAWNEDDPKPFVWTKEADEIPRPPRLMS
ncbi:hypothetical protein [Saccharothrix sp. NRRL B-16348]|nr:hypothetical protein [Saccharothrix sp. NRRL B-16348]